MDEKLGPRFRSEVIQRIVFVREVLLRLCIDTELTVGYLFETQSKGFIKISLSLYAQALYTLSSSSTGT
jgi:hypothetical protein